MADPRDQARKQAAAKAKADQGRRDARAEKGRNQRNQARLAAIEAKAAKRPRHTKPEYEALLCLAEERGWLVFRDEGYFKCRCPCAEKHINTVVLTPSSRRTLENTRARFRSFPCWKEEP
jgi:hypothetical protein